MDPPSKKRSIFGFTGLFRNSVAPTDEQNAKPDGPSKPAAPAPAQREINTASAPHSPVKRASDSQLASRKIIGRPQGPSSKLSQSISASEIAHRPSTSVFATPRRRPGDNPNKPASFSVSTASYAPANNPKATSFSGVASTPRNIFRSSALYSRPTASTLSPRVPVNTLNQSFPPATPGKTPRGSTADVNGRILANTTSSELFTMRIPSPPRHLTGEMLANEVPNDPSRPGSVYADEFLAHYCPPDLDEHQRRQFFCILDLRRLKYAADEVFTKKDWKINILNFAKEYEKSRSLIMLRYGLYEFKTVRASEAVKKEWKQKHGIPDSDDEGALVPKTNGDTKRKAEDDLTHSRNTLTFSVPGSNKRARVPEASAKNKRKADAEPEENQPAKLQKPTSTPQKTPSATKSFFESIAKTSQSSDSATPARTGGKNSLFDSTAPKLNGSVGQSLFGAAPKAVAPAGNIFGHLSDESKGNEGADEESETSSNMDEDESEVQDLSQSDGPAASGGTSTPQFPVPKTTLNGTSSASSEAGEGTQAKSLFDRISKDSDGQPIRKVLPGDGSIVPPPAVNDRSASPVKDQPVNNTWNANAPIKFSAPATASFGSIAPQPAASATMDFGASTTKKAEEAPAPAAAPAAAPAETPKGSPKDPPPKNLFAAQTKKTEEVNGASGAAPKAPAANLFSGFPAKSADASTTAPPIFGGLTPSTNTGTIFGSTAPAFGQPPKDVESKAPESDSTPASLFGAQPTGAASEAPKANVFQSSTLFGSQANSELAPVAQPQFGGFFGKAQTTEVQAEKPASSLFAAGSAKPAGNPFGSGTPSFGASIEEPAAKKFAFGNTETKSGSSIFGSGASTPAAETAKTAETKSLFGAASTPAVSAPETKSFFGAAPTPGQEKPLFGSNAGEAKPLFGSTAGGMKPLFGNNTGATESKPAALFGNSTPAAPTASSAPIFSFGNNSQTPAAPQAPAAQPNASIFGGLGGGTSFSFTTGGADTNTMKNPFAGDSSYSAPSSFDFGSGGTQTTNTPFSFGGGATAPTISFGGASDAGASNTQQTNSFGPTSGSMFSFGATQQSAPMFPQNPQPATSIFASGLAPGGGTSTGTNSPFTFGGASSLAATPAATTPEPSANAEDGKGTKADGDEAPQEQISLTEGGPGEEDESVVHEVRAKAAKLVTGHDSDDESGSSANKDKKKSPWKTQGVGPMRLLKNKTTGTVRMLLRAEPRGHVALNKAVLPNFTYKVEPGGKYVKITTATDDGKGLETWMLQVKTPALAQALVDSLEEHKKANEKK